MNYAPELFFIISPAICQKKSAKGKHLYFRDGI